MRYRVFLVFLFCSVQIVTAMEGHWVLTGSIAQTVSDDMVFYADDSDSSLIREINFRTGKVAEVLLQMTASEKPSWHGAGYSQEGEFLYMEIVGFGKVRIFWQKKLKNRLLLSYLVYITDEGIKQPEPPVKKEGPVSGHQDDDMTEDYGEDTLEINGLLLIDKQDLMILPGLTEADSEMQEEAGTSPGDARPDVSRQLLIISSYFKPE